MRTTSREVIRLLAKIRPVRGKNASPDRMALKVEVTLEVLAHE